MTPEELVEASSLNGQIDHNTLLDLAYIVLDERPEATSDITLEIRK